MKSEKATQLLLASQLGARTRFYSYRMCRDRRRPDGIASTIRHSPTNTIPMNPKAKASTAKLSPSKPLELWERVDRFLIFGAGEEVHRRMVDGRLRIAVNGAAVAIPRALRFFQPLGVQICGCKQVEEANAI